MKFRRYFHSYADIECNSIEECDNIDCSAQITEHLMVCQTRKFPFNQEDIEE